MKKRVSEKKVILFVICIFFLIGLLGGVLSQESCIENNKKLTGISVRIDEDQEPPELSDAEITISGFISQPGEANFEEIAKKYWGFGAGELVKIQESRDLSPLQKIKKERQIKAVSRFLEVLYNWGEEENIDSFNKPEKVQKILISDNDIQTLVNVKLGNGDRFLKKLEFLPSEVTGITSADLEQAGFRYKLRDPNDPALLKFLKEEHPLLKEQREVARRIGEIVVSDEPNNVIYMELAMGDRINFLIFERHYIIKFVDVYVVGPNGVVIKGYGKKKISTPTDQWKPKMIIVNKYNEDNENTLKAYGLDRKVTTSQALRRSAIVLGIVRMIPFGAMTDEFDQGNIRGGMIAYGETMISLISMGSMSPFTKGFKAADFALSLKDVEQSAVVVYSNPSSPASYGYLALSLVGAKSSAGDLRQGKVVVAELVETRKIVSGVVDEVAEDVNNEVKVLAQDEYVREIFVKKENGQTGGGGSGGGGSGGGSDPPNPGGPGGGGSGGGGSGGPPEPPNPPDPPPRPGPGDPNYRPNPPRNNLFNMRFFNAAMKRLKEIRSLNNMDEQLKQIQEFVHRNSEGMGYISGIDVNDQRDLVFPIGDFLGYIGIHPSQVPTAGQRIFYGIPSQFDSEAHMLFEDFGLANGNLLILNTRIGVIDSDGITRPLLNSGVEGAVKREFINHNLRALEQAVKVGYNLKDSDISFLTDSFMDHIRRLVNNNPEMINLFNQQRYLIDEYLRLYSTDPDGFNRVINNRYLARTHSNTLPEPIGRLITQWINSDQIPKRWKLPTVNMRSYDVEANFHDYQNYGDFFIRYYTNPQTNRRFFSETLTPQEIHAFRLYGVEQGLTINNNIDSSRLFFISENGVNDFFMRSVDSGLARRFTYNSLRDNNPRLFKELMGIGIGDINIEQADLVRYFYSMIFHMKNVQKVDKLIIQNVKRDKEFILKFFRDIGVETTNIDQIVKAAEGLPNPASDIPEIDMILDYVNVGDRNVLRRRFNNRNVDGDIIDGFQEIDVEFLEIDVNQLLGALNREMTNLNPQP